MGGFGSGYFRPKHAVIEEAQRISATGPEARQLKIARVFQPMPGRRGAARVMGLCPKCQKPRRFLFLVEAGPKCSECASLRYRSSQEQHSRARQMSRLRPSVTLGVSALGKWLDEPQTAGEEFKTAMATFEAIEKYSPQEGALTPEKGTPESATQRESTVKEDIKKSTAMLRQLEEAILNTAPTSTMLPKLVNAYVALSNMRDARAKIADEIQSGMPSDDGGMLAIERMIHGALLMHDPDYRKAHALAYPTHGIEQGR